MATINPFQGPINYSVDVQSPFEAAIGGFKLGAAGAEAQAQAQVREQAKKAQTELATLFKNPNATAADYERVLPFLPKDQADIVIQGFDRKTKAQQESDLRMGAEVYSAIKSGQSNVAIQRLTDSAVAFRNSGREQDAKAAEVAAEAIKINPTGAQATVGVYMARLPGGTGYLQAADKALETARAEAKGPAELREALAKAKTAETDARVKFETATDDIAKAKAAREFEQAKARKEQVQADTELQTRLSDLGFKKVQIDKFRAETRNLDTQGKMLSLDFQAALRGLPLPSKKTEGGGGAATEDERKAAGWLSQATNAYNNMLGAMYTKEGKATGAEVPGKFESALGTLPFIGEGGAALARSTGRQKFNQAASSLSEALLRAATGAGVNRDEAKQKLEELTPVFTDDADTRKQKLEAIPMYLESLKSRAGRAAPSGYQVPQAPENALSITLPDGSVFTAPDQKALDEFKRRAGL